MNSNPLSWLGIVIKYCFHLYFDFILKSLNHFKNFDLKQFLNSNSHVCLDFLMFECLKITVEFKECYFDCLDCPKVASFFLFLLSSP